VGSRFNSLLDSWNYARMLSFDGNPFFENFEGDEGAFACVQGYLALTRPGALEKHISSTHLKNAAARY
jgi:hypothetical protein